jgi:Cu+-exporting ATPase
MSAEFTTVHIEGMSCMSCVTKVDQALRGVDGVVAVHVDLDGKKAVVSGGQPEALVDAVETLGFDAKV